MTKESTHLTENDLIAFIASGAARLKAREVQHLVSELPDARKRFAALRRSPYPETERHLLFLSEVVDQVWTDAYRDLSYGAALAAAFAIEYFLREGDLIPDNLGAIGLTDDAAIVRTVLNLHANEYRKFPAKMKIDWTGLQGRPHAEGAKGGNP